MHTLKRLLAPFACLALALGFFLSPLAANASSLTGDQVNAIVSLLESFGADPATIASVEAALTGTAPAAPSCVSLSYNMGAGATDAATAGQVSLLQSFLGIAPTTGYFGPTTESAVESYQASHGIVSSGSPDTTGYGFVGPQTRAAMGCGGASAPVPSPLPTGSFSASPTSGNAPLTVTFSIPQNAGGQYIDFGDGATGCSIAPSEDCSVPAAPQTFTHTYTEPGTYTVTVSRHLPSTVIGTATITVASSATGTASATIDPSSLQAGTNGPTTITGTVSGTASVIVYQLPSTYTGGHDYASVYAAGQGQSNTQYAFIAYPAPTISNGHWSAYFGGWPPAGSYTVVVYDGATHALLATGTLTVTSSTSVPVQTNPVVINSFTVWPSEMVSAGQPVTFSWSSNLSSTDLSYYGGSCSIAKSGTVGINDVPQASGSFTYVPTETNTYTLTCSSGAKSGSPQATKQVPVNLTNNPTGTLTSSQIQSIASLLQSFGAPPAMVSNAQLALNGQIIPAPPSAGTVLTPSQLSSITGSQGLLVSFGASQSIITNTNNALTAPAPVIQIGNNTTLKLTVPSSVAVGSSYTVKWSTASGPTLSQIVAAYPSVTGQLYVENASNPHSGPGQAIATLSGSQLLAGSANWTVGSLPAGTYNIVLDVTLSSGSGGFDLAIGVSANFSLAALTTTFVGVPASGTAPLAVSFTLPQSLCTGQIETLVYGDGATVDFGGCSLIDTPNPKMPTYTHTYQNAGTYTAKVTAGNATLVSTAVSVSAPSTGTPSAPTISGPSGSPNSGVEGQPFIFTVAGTDPNHDQVHYGVDYEDGSSYAWAPSYTTYTTSGTRLTFQHIWATFGTFSFRAHTQDVHGNTSSWTNYTVTIPRPVCGLFRGGTDPAHMVASPNPPSSVADTDAACLNYCNASGPKAGDVCMRGPNTINTYPSGAPTIPPPPSKSYY